MRRSLIPTVAAILVVALTVSLGNWQMRRADEKAALQAARDAAMAEAPLSMTAAPPSLVDPAGPAVTGSASVDGRRLEARGEYLADRSVFLDNRTRNGVAGFHVFTPLRLEPAAGAEPRWVLVQRGWIARDPLERNRLPQLRTPQGEVTVQGLAQADLAQTITLGEIPAPAPGERLWQRLDLTSYAQWSALPVLPFVLRQTSETDDGLMRDWVQPGSGVDKHHGYAFQWYALGAATAALWLWVMLRRRLTR